MTCRDIKSCKVISRFLCNFETTIARIDVLTLFRVASKVVNPETGRVVPPACLKMVGAKGRIFKPHLIANSSLINYLDAPVSGIRKRAYFMISCRSG